MILIAEATTWPDVGLAAVVMLGLALIFWVLSRV